MGKGSKRRKEDVKKIRDNWNNIDWSVKDDKETERNIRIK